MSFRCAFLLMILAALAPLAASAQTTATLSGRVVDETAGVIAGASVSIRQIGTGFERLTTTDGQGRYVFASLPPGSYTVRAELIGFKPLVRTGLTLTIGQAAVADLTMVLGAISETITI